MQNAGAHIHPSSIGEAKANSSLLQAWDEVYTGQVTDLRQGVTQRRTTIQTHVHTYGQFRVDLICMFVGYGRKPKHLEKTHADMWWLMHA